MDREGLLEREEAAWPRLVDAAAAVPADRREVEGVVPGWSTHDLVWHCVYWAGYAGDVLETIRRGEPVVEREDDDAWQAEVLAEGRGLTWDDILARAEQNRERVRTAFSAFDDPPDEAVGWFTDDTLDHYEEHAAEIRAFGAVP